MFCNFCGSAVEDGAKFCGSCGAALNSEPTESTFAFDGEPTLEQATAAPKKKSNKKLLLIGGVVALALVLLIALFSCGGNGGVGGKDKLIGTWEGVAFYADEMQMGTDITGEFSFEVYDGGKCKLVMPSLGDTPDMVWAYDTATTDSYNATKTDGKTVRIYSVAFATNPSDVKYYAMLTDDGMGLLSTDSFSTAYTYKLIFQRG